MTQIDKRDRQIIGFIAARGEVFFKELEDSNMMAKSTLSKHLGLLRQSGLVAKTISEKKKLGSHETVYVLTPKGRKTLEPKLKRMSIDDFS
jgi:DNA-binding HxlR family transcriptional regulator